MFEKIGDFLSRFLETACSFGSNERVGERAVKIGLEKNDFWQVNEVMQEVYTESDSRIGKWQGGAFKFKPGFAGAEAAKLKKFSDTSGLKLNGCPT